MLTIVVNGGTYRNKKTGNHYYVLGIGKHTETGEDFVVYTRRDIEDKTVWVRPYDLFREKFEI